MIKRRDMPMQVLLFVVTLGLYGIYWFYVTMDEMIKYKGLEGSAALWTVLAIIPLLNLIAFYKQGEAVEALTEGSVNKWLMFVVWILISPAAWLITQIELNKRATEPA